MFLSDFSDLKKKNITALWIEREREGKRILNYKGLLTQYQNLRYLAEGIQSTVWEKKNQCVHLRGGLIYYHGREEIHNRSKKIN